MENEYIKGWGIKIGTFTPEQYRNGEAKKVKEQKIKEYGNKYEYTNMKIFKKNGKEFFDYYLCTADDVRITF